MLVTLGLAAGVGVIAIFFSTYVTGRVAGTALVSSICIGIAIPVSRLMEAAARRWAGVIGLASIVLAYGLFVLGIWTDMVVSGDTPWNLVGSGFVVLVGGVVAAYIVPFISRKGVHTSSVIALAAIALGMSILLMVIWLEGWELREKLIVTAALALGTGLILSLSLIGFRGSMHIWQWLGVVSGLVQCILGFIGVWITDSDDATFYAASVSLGVVVGHANVVLRVPTGPAGIWIKLAAIGGTAASGVCVTLLTILTRLMGESEPELLVRFLAASGLVATSATMAVVVMHVLHRRGSAARAIAAGAVATDVQVQLACPSCGRKLSLKAGMRTPCTGCGLFIRVEVQTPRCAKCEYPLLNIAGDRCPECGEPRASSAAAEPLPDARE